MPHTSTTQELRFEWSHLRIYPQTPQFTPLHASRFDSVSGRVSSLQNRCYFLGVYRASAPLLSRVDRAPRWPCARLKTHKIIPFLKDRGSGTSHGDCGLAVMKEWRIGKSKVTKRPSLSYKRKECGNPGFSNLRSRPVFGNPLPNSGNTQILSDLPKSKLVII